MALAEYKQDMATCCRCSACKFIPFENVQGFQNVNVCPSIARYNFHAYSGGGRMGIGTAMLEKKIDYSPKLLEVVYNCQLCGACDISCKYAMDMEVLDPIQEIRIDCVEKGHTLEVFDKMMAGFRSSGRMVKEAQSGEKTWFKDLNVRNLNGKQAEIVYHAGCRTAYDPARWGVAQSAVWLMQKAGVDVAIAGDEEACCGGRAYHLGYKEDFLKQAKANMARLKQAGVKTLVTGCAECYGAFKVLYDRFGLKDGLEVLHTTEYFAALIQRGDLKPSNKVDMEVTYHDPCHLGRLGEPHIPWEGKRIPGHIILFDPPKEFKRGTYGVYAPPREVLKSIPGIKLVEMERTREYAWCCGAGGGVKEYNPEFAMWTAGERVKEAAATGAKALVTACPGCEKSFSEAAGDSGMQVYDVVELLAKSTL